MCHCEVSRLLVLRLQAGLRESRGFAFFDWCSHLRTQFCYMIETSSPPPSPGFNLEMVDVFVRGAPQSVVPHGINQYVNMFAQVTERSCRLLQRDRCVAVKFIGCLFCGFKPVLVIHVALLSLTGAVTCALSSTT